MNTLPQHLTIALERLTHDITTLRNDLRRFDGDFDSPQPLLAQADALYVQVLALLFDSTPHAVYNVLHRAEVVA